jgi:hypothetical protein
LTHLLVPIASHFLAGSILSLVLPVGVVVVVLSWYWIVWRRGTEERARGRKAAASELPHEPAAESDATRAG